MRHLNSHFLPRCANEEYHLATRRGEPIHLDVTLPEKRPVVKDVIQPKLGGESVFLLGRLASLSMFEGVCVCVCVSAVLCD